MTIAKRHLKCTMSGPQVDAERFFLLVGWLVLAAKKVSLVSFEVYRDHGISYSVELTTLVPRIRRKFPIGLL